MKRKLYLSIAVILFPAIIYLVIFFANDPHGYFQVSSNSTSAESHPLIENMLEWKNGHYNAILIGDSRMGAFDAYIDDLNAYTGKNYKNMSYPGAMATEMNYLIRWCIENSQEPVDSIIIVSGWYNFNELLQQNRVESTKKIIENPFTYAFSVDNLRDLITSMKKDEKKDDTEGETAEDISLSENLTSKEESFLTTFNGMWSRYLSGFELSKTEIDELINISYYCKDHNISLVFVAPPWVDWFYTELESRAAYDMDDYKRILSQYFDIIDFEFIECQLCHNTQDFSDVSHFHGQTYEAFARELITGEPIYSRIWNNGNVK